MVFSKSTRAVWKRRIEGFWTDFSHNKIGLLGVAILSLFVIVAIFAPFIAPFTQDQVFQYSGRQADEFAYPDWIGLISPGLADLPRQENYVLNWSTAQLPASVDLERTDSGLTLYYNASISGTDQPVSVVLNSSFNYPYQPMRIFSVGIPWSASPDAVVTIYKTNILGWRIKVGETGTMAYVVQLSLITPNGTRYDLWDQNWNKYAVTNVTTQPAFWSSMSYGRIDFTSDLAVLAQKLGFRPEEAYQLPRTLMVEKGVYTFVTSVTMKPGSLVDSTGKATEVPLPQATGNVTLGTGKFTVWGRRWGVLGTDGGGHDVFSQLIYGCGISLVIGLSAASISMLFGVLVGVVSGYVGGGVDETLMRVVDVLLCLPLLPMLLVLIHLLGYNVYYIVLIIAIFGWQGLARVIRSQTLSIRETAYVESAVASGSSRVHIMVRHIIPNVFPVALTDFILAVPGAIILEAALSFLGMGDPFSPTWGKMLEYARVDQAYSPVNFAWWDILAPGIAITLICLSFVFIGHAVDEIMNPRLRRRR
jgi:ABC-type dipeptide/oligopeptide/nickel transport system permease subunit